MRKRTHLIKIGIVGGGPSGLSAALQLARKFTSAETLSTLSLESRDKVEIHLFEKRSLIGPSLPWTTETDDRVAQAHTIHFFSSAIVLDPSEPDAFFHWAIQEGLADPRNPKEFARSFQTRSTVGKFLRHQAKLLHQLLEDDTQKQNSSKYYVKLIENTNVEVTNIHTPNMLEVRKISVCEKDGSPISSPRRLTEPFAYLIIATGHIPSRSTAAAAFLRSAPPAARAKYIDQVFPTSATELHISLSAFEQFLTTFILFSHAANLDTIDPNATVGIVGMHLTGVDAVLALKAKGHQGKIVLASRTGLFPEICPRNEFPAEPFALQYLTKPKIEELRRLDRSLSLKDAVMTLMKQEFESATQEPINWDALCRPKNPIERLRKSLARYNSHQTDDAPPPKWQLVIFAIYRALLTQDQLRWLFDDQDFCHSFFQEGLASFWCGYSLWMTAEHAQELLDLYDSGQLSVVTSLESISVANDSPYLQTTGGPIAVDWVINASAASPHMNDITRQDSELWSNLRDEGKLMILRSRPGNSGFGIEKNTYKLLSSQIHSTYIVGGPMVWFTSDIFVVASRAKAVVNCITKDLVGIASPTMSRLPRPS